MSFVALGDLVLVVVLVVESRTTTRTSTIWSLKNQE